MHRLRVDVAETDALLLNNGYYCRLEKKVRDVVHKAFWDKLQEELNHDPPIFSQALSLIQEVKEVILYLV